MKIYRSGNYNAKLQNANWQKFEGEMAKWPQMLPHVHCLHLTLKFPFVCTMLSIYRLCRSSL
jgi:hypothetical protein